LLAQGCQWGTPENTKAAQAEWAEKFTWGKGDVQVAPNCVVEPPEQAPSEPETPEVAVPTTPEPEVPGKALPEVQVPMAGHGVAKHYWRGFGDAGGTAIASALGVTVQANNKAQSLTLTGPDKAELRRAAKVIVAAWEQGFAEFNAWRRTDADYRALPVQHEAASERCKAERVWLLTFAQARAADLTLASYPEMAEVAS
jgi:hypothetical protein